MKTSNHLSNKKRSICAISCFILILVLSFKEADISHLRGGCISVAVKMIPL